MTHYWVLLVLITLSGAIYIQCNHTGNTRIRKFYKFLSIMVWYSVMGCVVNLWRFWFMYDVPFWQSPDLVGVAVLSAVWGAYLDQWSRE